MPKPTWTPRRRLLVSVLLTAAALTISIIAIVQAYYASYRPHVDWSYPPAPSASVPTLVAPR